MFRGRLYGTNLYAGNLFGGVGVVEVPPVEEPGVGGGGGGGYFIGRGGWANQQAAKKKRLRILKEDREFIEMLGVFLDVMEDED